MMMNRKGTQHSKIVEYQKMKATQKLEIQLNENHIFFAIFEYQVKATHEHLHLQQQLQLNKKKIHRKKEEENNYLSSKI